MARFVLGEAFFDKDGNPISIDEYGRLFEDMEYRVIVETSLCPGHLVRTCWLGFRVPDIFSDTNLMTPVLRAMVGERDPRLVRYDPDLFGTGEIFKQGEPTQTIQEVQQYSTQDEARAGHEHFVAWRRANLEAPLEEYLEVDG